MDYLSFDNLTEFYDETRVFDESCFSAALAYLTDRFPPARYQNMFYPGIGTGRIAIPLAERGYRISGVDISQNMLTLLREKLSQTEEYLPVSSQAGNVLDLPFPDNTFGIAIAVHLFYFIRDWKTAVDEVMRVVKRNGIFVLMHTGMGTEVPFMNEMYKSLCSNQGYAIPKTGVDSNREVSDYCETLGYKTEWIRDRWQWIYRIRLDKALSYIRSRAYSFTTFASDEIHDKAVQGLIEEIKQQYGSLNAEVHITNQIYLAFISCQN